MFCIQHRSLDEGFGARWSELPNSRHEERAKVRSQLARIRETDDPEYLNQFRIVEVGSSAYFSQPTDSQEY